MKSNGRVEAKPQTFLTSVLGGDEWSVSRPDSFNPGKRSPGAH